MKYLLPFFVFFLFSNAHAYPINYVVEGDLSLSRGADEYSLDGAHFVWTIGADTELSPMAGSYGVIAGHDGYGQTVFYQSLSSVLKFTNRSNNASDIVSLGINPLLWTVNYPTTSLKTDIFEIRSSNLLNDELYGLNMTMFSLNYASDFYLNYDFASLPGNADSSTALIPYYGVMDNAESTIWYTPTNWSILTVAPVPEPSSVFLFGGGIAGLAWIARKRAK